MISDNQNGIYLNVYEIRVVIPEYKQKSLIWNIQTDGTLTVMYLQCMNIVTIRT